MNEQYNNRQNPPLRMTRQRQMILEELKKVTSHPTADAVYRMVRRRLPRISLGTVYRNLEVLAKHVLIQKLELGGSQRRYDGNPKRHYHVRCVRCGRVDDVPIGTMPAIEDILRGGRGYEILGYRLEFMGVCPKCRKSARRKK